MVSLDSEGLFGMTADNYEVYDWLENCELLFLNVVSKSLSQYQVFDILLVH